MVFQLAVLRGTHHLHDSRSLFQPQQVKLEETLNLTQMVYPPPPPHTHKKPCHFFIIPLPYWSKMAVRHLNCSYMYSCSDVSKKIIVLLETLYQTIYSSLQQILRCQSSGHRLFQTRFGHGQQKSPLLNGACPLPGSSEQMWMFVPLAYSTIQQTSLNDVMLGKAEILICQGPGFRWPYIWRKNPEDSCDSGKLKRRPPQPESEPHRVPWMSTHSPFAS
jgi:hypothetical protein